MSPLIETRRLTLRCPEASDAAAIAHHMNNFAVAGNLSRVPYPYSLADAQWWLGQIREDMPPDQTTFGIALDGDYVGAVGFHTDMRSPTLGYWLAEPFWHRGLMSEAAGAVVEWYFGRGCGDIIYCGAFAFNKASLAIQKKLGFTQTGTSTRTCLARDQELRNIDTELTRARWKGLSR